MGSLASRFTDGAPMPVISTLVEPERVTRIFFDCREAPGDSADQQRIEQAIERSFALARAEDNDPSEMLWLLAV
jgi:hypothetical protein